MAEDHDSSSGTKDNRSHEQKVLQESTAEEGHTGHVSAACMPHSSTSSLLENTAQRCNVSGSHAFALTFQAVCHAWLQAAWKADAAALYPCPMCKDISVMPGVWCRCWTMVLRQIEAQ